MSTERTFGHPIELEAKAVTESPDAWHFSGYASIFGSKDLGNDIVVPGAFSKSLKEHGLPLLLFNHKHDDVPVGTITEAKEDRRGLWVRGELPKDDTFVAGRLVPQLKRRGLKGISIGYRTIESERRKDDGARLLKEIRLYECSFVNMPMHPEAGLEIIKGESAPEELKEFLAALREFSAAVAELKEAMSESFDLAEAVWQFDAHLSRAIDRMSTIGGSTRGRSP